MHGDSRRPARQRLRPAWQGELAVIAFLMVVYDRVADLGALRVGTAVAHARTLLNDERRLHLAFELPLDRFVARHAELGSVLALYYDLAHGLVTIGVLVAVFLAAPHGYRRARRALVLVNLGALAVFLALPLAPPRLVPGAGFVDVVARSGTWSAWQSAPTVARHANDYASMPSLHVAWAVWVLLTVVAATPHIALQRLAWAHLALTVAVVLMTGNHYTADVVAGAGLTGGCWALAGVRPSRRLRPLDADVLAAC